jgi:uncharacterized Ntn-hydrolase superfamily protein
VASKVAAAVSCLFLTNAAPALATYSIVAADTATREVGGTGTSCLGGSDVYIIYGPVPGAGVIHAQAQYNRAARDRGMELIAQGTAPADVVAAITDPAFDASARLRQYGVVDVTGRTAGFTGPEARAFAGDRQGSFGTYAYSVQGNILTSEAVLNQAAAAFEASGCDLAERLMRALEAGAENGEGDNRCTPDGIPSDSSFLQVERPGVARGSYLELHVTNSGTESPLPGLREQFDAWRATHPCPSSAGSGGAGGQSSNGGGRAASGGASAGAATNAGTGGSAAGAPGARDEADAAEGCGCRAATTGASTAGGLVALAAWAFAWSRRRR